MPSTSSEGAYYGEDYEDYVTQWNAAIDDTVWAVGEGYLDAHLATIVKACIERRRHLAEHGVVPALNMPTAVTFAAPATSAQAPTFVPPVGGYASGWDKQRVETAVAAHSGSLMAKTYGFPIAGYKVNTPQLQGKVVRLVSVQNLSGYAVEIVSTMRSRAKVRLLEDPVSAGPRFRDAFVNGTLITVPGDALRNLLNV